MESWDSLGNLMKMAIGHWIQYNPNRTLQLLKNRQLGGAALREAKAAQEYVYRAKPDWRDAAWEAVREGGILTREESITEPDTEAEENELEALREKVDSLLEVEVKRAATALGENPEDYTLTGADVNAIVRATLKEAGLTWGWKPPSE